MGAGFSHVSRCFNPGSTPKRYETDDICTENAPIDETLGHSFCYVRSSARFVSPTHSDRFVSPSQSLRFDDSGQQKAISKQTGYPETGFRAISGASVSANSWTPVTVLQQDDVLSDAADAPNQQNAASGSGCKGNVMLDGFESTSSFTALPLQRMPRGMEMQSGPQERTFFMSGPIERGALSGPLDATAAGDNSGGVPFSAPLGEMYSKKRRRKKSISAIRKALYRNFSVVPVRNFIGGGRKDTPPGGDTCKEVSNMDSESNVQWALGKAGEDRVHVVVSEELGWLFVGIYDGFNGPDAPEFLMSHLYKAVHSELEGVFWDTTDAGVASESIDLAQNSDPSDANAVDNREIRERQEGVVESQSVKKVVFGGQVEMRRRRLWEFLVEDHPEDGLDLSGSQRFAFSVTDALTVNGAGSAVSRSSLLLSKLKHGLLSRHRVKDTSRSFPWRFWLEGKQKAMGENREGYVTDDGDLGNERLNRFDRKRKGGLVDHELVLGAMARALDMTEKAYLDLTDRVLDRYPELALMGSCLLAVLMRDEDVYVMNVGDSRAIVAQLEPPDVSCLKEESVNPGSDEFDGEGIVEEPAGVIDREDKSVNAVKSMSLTALQLSTDHSTSIEEEILRIQNEHPDDRNCIVNGRVKGRLKVTRAFGAGFLKQRRWNDTLLEMFRNDYIGTAPYISCAPSLHHHKLCSRDQFLVLSSDGLYQYFSNQEVVSHVRHFLEKFPDGDPAQHLIEELLFRAAKKAGMDFHELLDIPQGDRRKYHDDVTVMVVSLEGRIWKSSGKYV